MKGSSKLTVRDTSSLHNGKITGGFAKYGGGINIEASSVCVLESGMITGNRAKYGGGVYVADDGSFTMSGGIVSENTADQDGGGIYADYTATVTGGEISGNIAMYGGGYYFDDSRLEARIYNALIKENEATVRGGAVFIKSGSVNMTDCTISDNTSRDCGGIYVTDNTELTADDTVFSGNKSTDESGGAIVNHSSVTLNGCTLRENTAYKYGGAVYFNGSEMTLVNTKIINNSTQVESGGGIYFKNGTLNIDSAEITGNTGIKGGSAIYADKDSDDFNIRGKVIIKDNTNSDLFLTSGKKLKVNGQLSAGTQISVALQSVSGTFTTGFTDNNPNVDPNLYFIPEKEYAITLDSNGEVMVIESDWRFLQKQIDEIDDGTSGSYLILEKDWKAALNDQTLVIPQGKTIILNLNGHKIDAKGFTGTVIIVRGTLIIRDTDTQNKGMITGGTDSALKNYGTLTIESGNISDNSTADKGGAIDNRGVLTISGGKISDNTSDGDGGAISNEGTLTFSGGEISGNTAKNSGGAISIKNGTVTVTGGTICGNTASNYHGGAIYLGCSSPNSAVLNLYSGSITENRAALEGGGILYGANSTINVKGSPSVKDNSAPTGKNILIRSSNKIVISSALSQDAVLDIALKGDPSQALTQNYSLYDCIKKNFPYDEESTELKQGADGELYLPEVISDITVNTWDELQAQLSDSNNNGKTIAIGSDLDGSGKDRLLFEGGSRAVTVDLCGHSVNLKRTSKGDTKHVFEAKGGAALTIKDSLRTGIITGGWENNGGGIYVNDNSSVKLQYVTVLGNRAEQDGGGIYVKGTLDMTGGCVEGNISGDNGGGIYCDDNNAVKITLNNVRVAFNTSKNGGGGLNIHLKDSTSLINKCIISHNKTTASNGGGFSISAANKTLKITDTAFDNNTAKGKGGGVYIDHGTVDLENGIFSLNEAGEGGAVYVTSGDAFKADGTLFEKNTSSSNGGAIGTAAALTLTGCTVKDNISSGKGGGVYQSGSDGTNVFTDLILNNNTASGDGAQGGGLYVGGGKVKMVGGTVSSNSCGEHGGGVYVKSGRDGFISENTVYSSNTAYKSGGGLYVNKGSALVKGGSFTKNQPRVSGGGVYVNEDSTVTVEDNVIFSENRTGYGGSAIYLEDDGTLNLYGATITQNDDGDKGAVLGDEDIHIKGKNIVKDNTGGDVYFLHNEEFKIDGVLDDDSKICVALEDELGTFTENLKKYNPDKDPNLFFNAPVNYSVRLDDDGEARIIGSDWIYLQDEIDAAQDGAEIKLTKDYKADPIDKTLVFPKGKSITLDLNGCTLDKNGNNQVIRVPENAVLTLKDSSDEKKGKITGGSGFNGGGILVQGTLVFESGIICDNEASNGGGIYNSGTLTVCGGIIKENMSGYGGGIFNAGTMNFESGSIKSNKARISGGGIRNTGTLSMQGGIIKENTAVQEGGGITVIGTNSKLNVSMIRMSKKMIHRAAEISFYIRVR